MHVAVIGAGVIGVSTAWYLRQKGHEVTVVDRQPGPGMETSYANAGEISPGYSTPWAAPGIPVKAAKWMLDPHSPLIITPAVSKSWMVQFLTNCNTRSYEKNKSRMVRVAEYSRECLIALRDELNLEYDQRSLGTLQVFRKPKQMRAVEKDIRVLERDGVPYELLDSGGCARAEPALARTQHLIVGGLRLPQDETGDCRKFTQQLAEHCEKAGVTFLLNHYVTDLNYTGSHAANGVIVKPADDGRHFILHADATVVCLGSYSAPFLREAGIRLPIEPVKGYSLTYPVESEEAAPVSTVMDETYKVAITRLGDRVRVGGLAELAGFELHLDLARRRTLIKSVGELFPAAGPHHESEFWCGLRPMTPDGTPIIGRTAIDGVWTNTGHGTLGWTMATGSGRMLADMISGSRPDIRTDDLSMSRYG